MINDSMNYKRITIFAKDTQNDMKRFIGHTILILLAEIFLFCPITMSQNNPYKINDQLYSYYQKCNSAIRKPEVLLMADTLFHMAKKKGDVKAQCLALNLKSDHYYFINDINTLLIEKEKVADFARNTPYKQYIFGAWNRIITYYLRNREYDSAIQELKKYQADVCVVVAFGQILPKEILEMTPYGCINVHASLLPKYRGAAPIQWAVINGEKVSGVTTMQMDEGLDTGDMLEKVEITLDKKETGGSLFDKLSAKGAALCVHTLAELEKGTITPQKQGESTTEYAKMLNKKSGEIDWTKTAVEIERLIRGLNPWPSAYTQWEGKTMKIWEAEVEDVVETIDTHEPGTITEVTKHGFKVQTGEGRLAIKSLQIPGKKRMEADAFLRGYHIETGTKLG